MYTAPGKTRLVCAMIRRVLIHTVSVACVLIALPVSAQSTPGAPAFPGDNLVPITIVLVDNGSPTGLLRRSGVQPQNVILLDSANVSAQGLSNAVFSLLLMEAVDATGQRRGNNELQRADLSAPHPRLSVGG
jgi:uncharacterized SAM-binding protein YcdF (DUF218 family)